MLGSITKIKDTDYHDLCLAVVDKYCEEYLNYPGGYNQHHAAPGGLAAHSCNMDSEMDSLLSTRRGIRDGEPTGYNRHLRRNISFAA